jgi:hypothetical protein
VVYQNALLWHLCVVFILLGLLQVFINVLQMKAALAKVLELDSGHH